MADQNIVFGRMVPNPVPKSRGRESGDVAVRTVLKNRRWIYIRAKDGWHIAVDVSADQARRLAALLLEEDKRAKSAASSRGAPKSPEARSRGRAVCLL